MNRDAQIERALEILKRSNDDLEARREIVTRLDFYTEEIEDHRETPTLQTAAMRRGIERAISAAKRLKIAI